MEDIDYRASQCPCCGAARTDGDKEWPWKCACNTCPVATLGRSCRRAGPCWSRCPYQAAPEPA